MQGRFAHSSHDKPHAYQVDAVYAAARQPSEPPRSTVQAMYSNAGRPPCSFAKFGFGGRCCLFRLPAAAPGYSRTYQPGSAYMLSILASRAVPRALAGIAPVAAPAETGGGKRQSKGHSLQQSVAELQDWPGPMSQSAPATKALAIAVEKRAAAAARRGQAALALLWRVLLVMAKHRGAVLDSTYKKGNPQDAILALVKQALHSDVDVEPPNPAESSKMQAWVAHTPDTAAMCKIEGLLLEGNRCEALAAAVEAQACCPHCMTSFCTGIIVQRDEVPNLECGSA